MNGSGRVSFNVFSPTLTDTGLTNKVAYHYYVYAKNDVGLSNRSADIYVVPKKPGPELTAPVGLTATNNSYSITLNWHEPYSQYPIQGYRIFRSLNETGVMSFQTTTNLTTYTDSAVVVGMEYDYYVRAFNVLEEGQMSKGVTAHAQGDKQDLISTILSMLPYILAMLAGIGLMIFYLGRRKKGGRKKSKAAKRPAPKK